MDTLAEPNPNYNPESDSKLYMERRAEQAGLFGLPIEDYNKWVDYEDQFKPNILQYGMIMFNPANVERYKQLTTTRKLPTVSHPDFYVVPPEDYLKRADPDSQQNPDIDTTKLDRGEGGGRRRKSRTRKSKRRNSRRRKSRTRKSKRRR